MDTNNINDNDLEQKIYDYIDEAYQYFDDSLEELVKIQNQTLITKMKVNSILNNDYRRYTDFQHILYEINQRILNIEKDLHEKNIISEVKVTDNLDDNLNIKQSS